MPRAQLAFKLLVRQVPIANPCRPHPHIPLNLYPSVIILERVRGVDDRKVKSADDLDTQNHVSAR